MHTSVFSQVPTPGFNMIDGQVKHLSWLGFVVMLEEVMIATLGVLIFEIDTTEYKCQKVQSSNKSREGKGKLLNPIW